MGTPKDTEAKMKQSVQMHIGRLHSKSIPTFKKKHAHAHAHANGNGHVEIKTVLPSSRRGAHTNGHTAPVRRKYTRTAHVHTHDHSPSQGTDVKINHCYNCGTSIQGLAEGVVLAQLIKGNPRFRAKVEKLLAKI